MGSPPPSPSEYRCKDDAARPQPRPAYSSDMQEQGGSSCSRLIHDPIAADSQRRPPMKKRRRLIDANALLTSACSSIASIAATRAKENSLKELPMHSVADTYSNEPDAGDGNLEEEPAEYSSSERAGEDEGYTTPTNIESCIPCEMYTECPPAPRKTKKTKGKTASAVDSPYKRRRYSHDPPIIPDVWIVATMQGHTPADKHA